MPFPAATVAALEARKPINQGLPPPRPKIMPGVVNPQAPKQPQFEGNLAAHLRASPDSLGDRKPAMIPVPALSSVRLVSEAEAISIAVPSNFAFYKFKDLYVRPFRGLHLAKLSKAHKERSLTPIIEAVSSVLSTTEGNVPGLGYYLTIPDFYFVLYWLRLNSFTKSTYQHTTVCLDEQHNKDVEEGKKTKESLRIQETVNTSKIQIDTLTEIPNPYLYVLDYPDYILRPCTVLDTVEIMEHPKASDDEFQYLAQKACYLTLAEGSTPSLDQRISIVEEMTTADLSTIAAYEKASQAYGVKEQITVRCTGCGAKRATTLTLDAHSFLSAE